MSNDPCPGWCVTRPDVPAPGEPGHVHHTAATEVDLPEVMGMVSTRGGLFGNSEIALHAFAIPSGSTPTAGDLYVPARDGARLAAVLDVLSHASPEHIRELAAGVRRITAEMEPEAGA